MQNIYKKSFIERKCIQHIWLESKVFLCVLVGQLKAALINIFKSTVGKMCYVLWNPQRVFHCSLIWLHGLQQTTDLAHSHRSHQRRFSSQQL